MVDGGKGPGVVPENKFLPGASFAHAKLVSGGVRSFSGMIPRALATVRIEAARKAKGPERKPQAFSKISRGRPQSDEV